MCLKKEVKKKKLDHNHNSGESWMVVKRMLKNILKISCLKYSVRFVCNAKTTAIQNR